MTFPSDGVSSPAHKASRVVFPLPEGPTIAQEAPCSSTKLTAFRTVNCDSAVSYVFVRFLTSRIGGTGISFHFPRKPSNRRRRLRKSTPDFPRPGIRDALADSFRECPDGSPESDVLYKSASQRNPSDMVFTKQGKEEK